MFGLTLHLGIIQVSLLSAFTTMGVLIVGSPMWLVFLYQTLSVIATHSIMLILQCQKMGYHFELFHRISRYVKVHHHYKLTRTVIMAIFFGLGPAFRNV
jgi:hypothetical protein